MLARLTRPKLLHCSFCGRDSTTVLRLLGGPKAFICDDCVAACVDILAASGDGPADPRDQDDATLLSGLQLADASVDSARGVLQSKIDTLRDRGVSWERIGDALGVSRQAAWERFSR